MKNEHERLINKWLIINDESGCYCVGRIDASVSASHLLVRMRPPQAPPYSRIYAIDDLADESCMVLDTEQELNAWEAWANEEDPPRRGADIINLTGAKRNDETNH